MSYNAFMKISYYLWGAFMVSLFLVQSADSVSVTGDYDGDGLSDQPIYDSRSGNWYIKTFSDQMVTWGRHWKWGEGRPVTGDYDGDGKSDLALFDPVGGYWYIRAVAGDVIACGTQWGWNGAQPVSGDYDGDGKSDLAVLDQARGFWFIRGVDGTPIAWQSQWGWSAAKPVPGDYDGDGKWDLAVFDTAGGYWYIRKLSGDVLAWKQQWGWSTAKPVPGDYDGDGKFDLAVFDTAGGYWYIRSLTGSIIVWKQQWGWSTARPIPGDYDGDGKWDLAVFDTVGGYWYIRNVAGSILAWNNQWGWNTATVPSLGVEPVGMAVGVEAPVSYMPPVTFEMGELAASHSVQLSPYFVERYEVSKALWDEVRLWAIARGYGFDGPGSGKASLHPVQTVSWFDAVKWCNARSEKMGFVPCYYTDSSRTTVYRTGLLYLSTNAVLWSANGYRLPTEAEWENASKTPFGQRFPWGDTISHDNANYNSLFNTNQPPAPYYAYDVNGSPGFNVAYNDGVIPYTAPVNVLTTNYNGLFNLSGNVAEWCWDYSSNYPSPGPPVSNPMGPDVGFSRVVRGGSWFDDAAHVRCADRLFQSPWVRNSFIGFRCVRRVE
jgi:formylglycine-generating enzyme required for sulfatase activity